MAKEVPGAVRSQPGVSLVFAGPVPAAATDGPLRSLAGPRSYLTSYRFRIAPSSPGRDPTFTPASDRRPYQQAIVRYEDVYLGGVLVAAGAGLLLAGALAWWLWRRRRAA